MAIKDLKPYENVEAKFVVKFKKPVQEYAKGYSFQLRIGDSTGETMLKYWGSQNKEEVEKLYNSIKKDDVIFVKGTTSVYKERVEINVDKEGFIKVLSPEEYDVKEFIKVTEKDIENMFKELVAFANSVKDKNLKKILDIFINDFDFIKAFKNHPAAMYKHHGWIGGLLEHTLNVTKICDFLAKIHPDIDRDLVVTGAILHDIGKIKELEMKTSIKTSKEGMLLGHTVLGFNEVSKRLDKVDVPEDLKLKLIHIIISHHGKIEYGTPKEPAFPEALAVYFADDMDAKLTEMITHKKTAETEDDYVYNPDFGLIYLK
jgi:3'-5' exoribonuclease